MPTQRRGVIPIGPATTVRGDPFGLLRRAVTWTELHRAVRATGDRAARVARRRLAARPRGQTTNDLSMSDLAFHALREYEPGDDRRYIHWRSSAKAGRFLVRQFLDTRRSHIAVVVDSDAGRPTPTASDFELAISAAASIASARSRRAGDHRRRPASMPCRRGTRHSACWTPSPAPSSAAHGWSTWPARGCAWRPTPASPCSSPGRRPFTELQPRGRRLPARGRGSWPCGSTAATHRRSPSMRGPDRADACRR